MWVAQGLLCGLHRVVGAMAVWDRWLQALLVVGWLFLAATGMDSSSDDSHMTKSTTAAMSAAKLWVIYQGVKVMTCKLCGGKSTDEVPYPEHDDYDASTDMFQRRRPWLHYTVCDGGRRARGRVCAWCWSVFKQSGLFNAHDSLKAYLAYIKPDRVTRHAPFLKMLKKYEAKQEESVEMAESVSACRRTRFSRNAIVSQTLSSHERSGIREKVEYNYIELPIWQAENPGKTAPKVVKAWVLDSDTGF